MKTGSDKIDIVAVEDHGGILTIRGRGADRDWNGIHYKQGTSAKNVGATGLSAKIATIPSKGVAYAHIHAGFEVIFTHYYRDTPRSAANVRATSCFGHEFCLSFLFPMNGVFVIVPYRPKPGKESELFELVRNRIPTLLKGGLVTDRRPTIMQARDRTIIEVSEWKSRNAIDTAHKNPNVLAMWNNFFALCDCVPLNTLAEASEMFAGFEPVDG